MMPDTDLSIKTEGNITLIQAKGADSTMKSNARLGKKLVVRDGRVGE
jgi:hypothetical protein